MKRIFTLLALAAFTLPLLAQSPDLMSYQAVLRNAENNLITNQAVAVQISILQGTPNGTSVFTEVHTLSTNANGLISLVIGDGFGDDLSTIDWSAGPYFIKTETDPAGGSNYTISSTTQLMSVPYAKYADEAGNVFSGAYGDLTGAPTVVSAFTNDEGYLTGVTGSETAFDAWDKNAADDFSGAYGDLTGAPTAVSAFTNDAGYLTSQLWSQNGSDLYYLGGNIGIGTSTPTLPLTIHSGAYDTWSILRNNSTGANSSDGLLFGIRNDYNAYLWNYEAGPLIFGTNGTSRIMISADGDVAIGNHVPTSRLDVRGDAKFGSNGVAFTELREITGTTGASGTGTTVALPSGYTEDNTRVLSVEINYGGTTWTGLGSHYRTPPASLYNQSYILSGTSLFVYYPNEPEYHSRAIRVLIMQIAP
jgi:hypothetical protein